MGRRGTTDRKQRREADKRRLRPLTGFGPIGWCLVPIALTLAVVRITGYDLQYQFLRLLSLWIGGDGMYLVFHHLITVHWVMIQHFQLGLIGMMYGLLALHIAPGRIGLWRPAILIAWCVAGCWLLWHPPLGADGVLAAWLRRCQPEGDLLWWVQNLVLGLGSTVVLWLATRSRRVTLIALSAAVVGVVTEIFNATTPLITHLHALILWHLLFAGALLWWAVAERRRTFGPGQCQSCGYDVKSLRAGALP